MLISACSRPRYACLILLVRRGACVCRLIGVLALLSGPLLAAETGSVSIGVLGLFQPRSFTVAPADHEVLIARAGSDLDNEVRASSNPIASTRKVRLWTDDYSNLLQILK